MKKNKQHIKDDFDIFDGLDDVDASDINLDDIDTPELQDDFFFEEDAPTKKEKVSFLKKFKSKKKNRKAYDIIASEPEEATSYKPSSIAFPSEEGGALVAEEATPLVKDDSIAEGSEGISPSKDEVPSKEEIYEENEPTSPSSRVVNFINKHYKRLSLIICIIIALALGIFFLSSPINDLISRVFSHSKETLSLSEKLDKIESAKETNVVPFEDAATTKFAAYSSGIIACKANYLVYYDKNGEEQWHIDTPVVDPLLSVNNEYILTAENNGTWIYLYKNDTLLFSTEADYAISDISLSSEGDSVIITQKPFYKGSLQAFNKAGVCIYQRSFGKDYIITAAISPKTRNIAVALMNTTKKLTSSVEIFNITQNIRNTQLNFNTALLCGLEYNTKGLTCYTDMGIYGFNNSGDEIWKHEFSKKESLQKYNYDSYGNKIALVSNDEKPEIHIYNHYGSEKKSYLIDDFPEVIGTYNGKFIYSSARSIVFGSYSFPHEYAASMDVKGVYVFDSDRCMIVYSNSIEFIEL